MNYVEKRQMNAKDISHSAINSVQEAKNFQNVWEGLMLM